MLRAEFLADVFVFVIATMPSVIHTEPVPEHPLTVCEAKHLLQSTAEIKKEDRRYACKKKKAIAPVSYFYLYHQQNTPPLY